MDLRLKDRVAIVTGGSSGIGAATSRLFVQEGAKVAIFARDRERGERIAGEISDLGGECVFLRVDVSLEDQVREGFKVAVEKFGRVDILVNNAGIYEKGDIFSFTEKDFQELVDVNIKGVLLCTKYAVEDMRKRSSGVIVNVSSEAGIVGIQNQVIYNLTKSAVIAITKSCALDLAPYGIRVNCVCPGTTHTPLVDKAREKYKDAKPPIKILSRVRALDRWGMPEEIASAIVFLSSDIVSYATGTILSVDGGYTI